MILLTDEEIQEATDKHPPVWEINGEQLPKVEILQRQHARLREIAKAQLKKVADYLVADRTTFISRETTAELLKEIE